MQQPSRNSCRTSMRPSLCLIVIRSFPRCRSVPIMSSKCLLICKLTREKISFPDPCSGRYACIGPTLGQKHVTRKYRSRSDQRFRHKKANLNLIQPRVVRKLISTSWCQHGTHVSATRSFQTVSRSARDFYALISSTRSS